MRTTIDIEADLLKRLRDEALKRGVSFKEVVSGVIRRALDAAPPDKLRPYKGPTFAMGAPSPLFDLDMALSLAATLEDGEVAAELARRK